MTIDEIIGMLPEDKREPIKAELASYVKIADKDTADKVVRENPYAKSVLDSYISKAVASHDERFQAEKLPGLVEAEILKRNPPKDERDKKIAEIEQKLAQKEREAIVKEQTARAVQKAAELGIPLDIARRYIGETDEATDKAIESLAGVLKPWLDEKVKAEVVARLGGAQPKAGELGKAMSVNDFNKLPPKEQAKYIAAGGVLQE